MAFGFIKKIFSFGKKQVEEVLAEGEAAEAQRTEAPEAGQPKETAQPVETRPVPAETTSPSSEAEAPPRPQPAPEPEKAPKPEPKQEPPEPEPEKPAKDETPPEQPDVSSTPQEVVGEPGELEPAKPSAKKAEPKPAKPSEAPAPAEQKPASAKKAPPKTPEPAPEKPRAREEPGQKPPVPVEPEEKAKPEPAAEQPSAPELPAAEPEKAEPEKPAPTSASMGEVAKHGDAGGGEPEAQQPSTLRTDPPHKSEGGTGKVTVSKSVERTGETVPAPEPEQPRASWLQRLRAGLSRSSKELSSSISGVFTKRRLDEDTLQDLEDVLIRADLGAETAMRIADTLSSGRFGRDVSDQEVRSVMASEIEKVLSPVAQALELDLSHKPHVILVVGVNGTGKTTTIGKLAAKLVSGGLSVTLAAGDTFRAAAIEQLKIWGERTGSPVVSSKLGADAAGLAWDAYEKAKAEGSDVLIIDTAGRLQNKAELMAELEKIVRVLAKRDPEAPHTVLQTVDATTGQNALNQVEIFRNVAGVNGIVMTKLDGTARGGILVAIAAKHKLPVYFIGVGEQVDDLEPFSAHDFAAAIAGTETA
jgi:fused signal recognition particle receptor